MTEDDFVEADRDARLRNSAVMEDLVAANNESSRHLTELVKSVHLETAARDRKVEALEKGQKQVRVVIGLGCALVVILMMIGVFNAVSLNQTRRNQQQVTALNATVLDCVNGTGECGQRNSADQGRLLEEVKKYNLIGFYCIRNNPPLEDPKAVKFLACMDRMYPTGPKLPQQR